MKKLLLTIGFCIIGISSGYGQIISQYIETNSGSTPKGIEIFNNTGATLDFSVNNLVIKKGTNGAALSPDHTVSSGTLASGDVMVIGTSDIDTYMDGEGLTSVLFSTKSFTFNGDDALSVEYGGVVTDVFGDPGTGDPGSDWNGNGVSTANQNIQLKSGITTGDTDGFTDPSERFETVSTNPNSDLTGFGVAPASGASATKLNISLVNSGNSPTKDIGFEVVVQALDASDQLANVDSDIDITFTLGSGNGSLGGTTTGTISSGNSSVTISGTTYDTAESGVSITVADDASGLTSATSSTFEVLDEATKLVIKDFPSSGAADVSISSFTVEIQRSDDSIDLNNTSSITISKVSGSGTMGGTLTRNASSGVATFDDITFDADDDYTIQATDGTLTSAVSSTITLSSPDFTETFETENFNVTGSYGDGSFVGTSGVEWTYVESRDDAGYPINGDNAIMLRRSSDNSSLTSNVITGGISDFSVKFRKAFTGSGNRQIELFIGPDASNLTSIETSDAFDVDGEIRTFTVSDINYVGDFVLRISNVTSSQVNIDDITWNSFDDGEVSVTGTQGWRLISSPVTASFDDVLGDLWTQGFTGADSESGTSSVYSYDESVTTGDLDDGFTSISNQSDNLTQGFGYAVYVYSDDNGPGTAGDAGFPKTISFSGSVPSANVGPVDFTFNSSGNAANDGWNLAGNPFGKALNVDDLGFSSEANLDNFVYVYRGGSYTALDASGTANTDTVGVGEGFFVKTSAAVSYTYPIAAAPKSVNYESRNINFTLNNADFSSKATLRFHDQAAFGKESYDAYYLASMEANHIGFYSTEDGNKLAVNSLPYDLDMEVEVPFEISGTETGSFTLNWESPSDFDAGWTLTLIDNVAEAEIDLTEETSYTFDVNGTVDNRFAVKVVPSTAVSNEFEDKPVTFGLEQNYPNPFNPSTTIKYSVGESGPVSIAVYNVMGQKVADLVNATRGAGEYQVTWNASNNASGIYYYRLTSPGQVITRQMTLIK